MAYAVCPGCDENVYIPGAPKLGQKVFCKECEAELEVVNLDPVELDWPYDYDDDWDEDEEDNEDDEDDR
jgi:alpha-aminoadipate carrier protein LysW